MANYDYGMLQNGSDIRGVALPGVRGEDVNITPEVTSRIAKGFLYSLTLSTGKSPADIRIALGRDSRLSGSEILNSFCEALLLYGVCILDCGLASTPAMFMSTVFPDYIADGAVMITASHLPWNRNGFKFFTKNGGLDKGDITDILNFAESAQIISRLSAASTPENEGKRITAPLMRTYSANLRKIIIDEMSSACEASPRKGNHKTESKPLSGMKICVDAGNGAGGFYANEVLKPLGADISASRYLDPDGRFPNHPPNPENSEAMQSVCGAVLSGKCDLGLIFDTDVDRSSAVDENGKEISRNAIVAMAAALIADKYPGSTVVTDSITSDRLHDYLEEVLNLRHLRYKRGYRNVINKSIELNNKGIPSYLAIETSGHAAYKDNFFLDDGAFLATRIVIRAALLFKQGKGISSVLDRLSEPAESVEIRLPINASDFAACAQEAIDAVLSLDGISYSPFGIKCSVVRPNYEGVRISFCGDFSGWFLIRRSLHDPILPVNIESDTPGGVEAIKKLLKETLSRVSGVDTSLFER